MDKFNEIIKVINPVLGFSAKSLISGFITAIFYRGNIKKAEFEKIKNGQIDEVLKTLIKDRRITFTELYKCENILKLAEKVDKIREEKDDFESGNTNVEFDFDWFLRFFESAGYISNENMQDLWARILAGEMENKGSFTLRTLSTLANMCADEAKIFAECAKLRIVTPYNEYFLINSDQALDVDEDNYISGFSQVIAEDSDIFSVMATIYKISIGKINVLEQCGLIHSIFVNNTFDITKKPTIINNDIAAIVLQLKPDCEFEEFTFEINGYRFSAAALELFQVIKEEPSLEFILDFGRLIEATHSFIDVKIYKRIGELDRENIYDDRYDILHSEEYKERTNIFDLDAVAKHIEKRYKTLDDE